MTPKKHVTILGAGPAGLAIGYYAKKNGLDFTIYEGSSHIGGNCSTFKHGEFLLDSGAHRFHDKNPEVTKEILQLMGDDILKISVPSQIYHRGKFIDFPLSPFDLMKKLGIGVFVKSGFDLVGSRLKGFRGGGHFESFAIYTYGREMAQRFLLNYSQKLWGFPCDQLSPQVSGKRMKGLNLKTFLKEAFSGHKEKTEHLDGTFYYPKFGYGMIAERLADYGGRENIKLNTRVTKVFHSANKIDAIEVNGKDRIETRDMVNTLPLSIFLTMMEPKLPQDILKIVQDMRFRHVILVAVFINKKNVTPNGSVYFPDPDFPFTRVYEPRNRSIHMAPEGKTSLVAEIPCFGGDALWQKNEIELTRMVKDKLIEVGWVDEEEIIGSRVYRLYNAYPVLALGFEERIEEITLYLDRFSNLEFSGRGGKFVYAWLHDMMQFGKDIIEEYAHA